MLRLTGTLTGSALTIAALFLVIGIPRPGGLPESSVAEVPDEETQPAPQAAVAAPKAIDANIDEPASVLRTVPTAESSLPPDADSSHISSAVSDSPPAMAPLTEDLDANALESKWFAFWSPFRSQIAADGFVSELQRTTGLDYRVVKLKPGVYEVAFEYSDDLDRQDKLSRIAAATGLDLSDG